MKYLMKLKSFTESKTYIKTYEDLRGEFVKVKDENYKSFSVNDLKDDYVSYKPDFTFINLIKEMILNKKIAFQCGWCYDINMINSNHNNHSVIGICEKVEYEDESFWDSDIIVKMLNDDAWHTLFNPEIKKRIRIYNYVEGPLMKEFETLKDANKYNL